MSELRLYYDLSCPWSYIALVRLHDVADRNATPIDLRPVVVDDVLATENPELRGTRFAANPAKEAWQRSDLDIWAQFWGLTIDLPADWPFPARRAAHACAVAAAAGVGIDFSLRLYRAIFGEGKPANDPATLSEVAVSAGLEEELFVAALGESGTADKVEKWTAELVRLGGFGTPTMLLDSELFFGNDRIPLVEWKLGPISSEDFVMPGQHGQPGL